MKFTEKLKQDNQDLWIKSQEHPFVQGVASGSLPLEKFRFYMINDLYFLEHYLNAHLYATALVSDYSVKTWLTNKCNDMSHGQVEDREKYRKIFNYTDEEIENFEPAPAAYGYTSHLYREAMSGSLGRVIAAILPCYWVYADIGLTIKGSQPGEEVYQNFVDTYSSERFQNSSQYMVDLIDRIADQSSSEEQEKIAESFVLATEYELAFWEMSWTQEQWLSKRS